MTIYQLGDFKPEIDPEAYVAAEATVIGQVVLGPKTTVWPGVVIRGDNELIRVGACVSIQEGSVLHVDPGCALSIGDNATIGHQVMLHGCTIEEGALIGIQSVVLNNAVIGKNSLVGAGSVVTEGKVFPPRSLILGAPAKVVRELTDAEVTSIEKIAVNYSKRAALYKKDLKKIG